MMQYPSMLTDGYSQSKWVAEQLVLKAMERGLPAAIYRPGVPSSHKVCTQETWDRFFLVFHCEQGVSSAQLSLGSAQDGNQTTKRALILNVNGCFKGMLTHKMRLAP